MIGVREHSEGEYCGIDRIVRYAFRLTETRPRRIIQAIEGVLADERVKTPDLGGTATTAEMTKAVTSALGSRQPAEVVAGR